MTSILFILKRREDYNPLEHTKKSLETGLYNSARFVNDVLVQNGIPSKMVTVIDNNCIDREVTKHNPSHVIIEALWVVPQKFIELTKLHPNVKWIIRLHSEVPFLSQEGMSFDWIGDYSTMPNVYIAANSPKMLDEVRAFLRIARGWGDITVNRRVLYLPNYYPQQYTLKLLDYSKPSLDVACFGAVRPLKNHMTQAIATLKFAEQTGKRINFHINHRIELQGDSVFKNLRMLFAHVADAGHRLFIHGWLDRPDFINLCREMDIGLQVSFSETFNIVGADLTSVGVPVIGSDDIPWLSGRCRASASDSDNITQRIVETFKDPYACVVENQLMLTKYTSESEKVWIETFT